MIKKDLPLNFFRHEIKFVVKRLEFFEIEHLIKHHPSFFSEIFYERRINNIYFDSINNKNYKHHTEGHSQRIKIRIRWYNNLFGWIKKPMLEFKIKEGFLIRKKSFKLVPFKLDEKFDLASLQKDVFEKSNLPNSVLEMLKTSHPSILNSYKRKYFLSFDKKIRITLDKDLEFFRIKIKNNKFKEKIVDHITKIIEIKYSPEFNKIANEITQHFPFRIVANSKYIHGIDVLNL